MATKLKLKEDILNVLRSSEEMLCSFRSRIENKYLVIFVGNTRNGKSTLVSYIMGAPLVAFQDQNGFKIQHQNGPNPGPSIGHGTLSHTSVPEIIEMKGRSDTLIIDAPGFDDNRGVLQEIVNALYINQIKYAKGVRFVLVSDINNIINDNINYFLSFIDSVQTIMPDFVKLKGAVSIIFTKDSKQYNQDELARLLKTKILDVGGLRCKKDLIRHFVERKDLVGLFKMPTVVGALTDEVDVNVHDAIFKSDPINLSISDIRFGISKSARVVLLETYLDFFDVVLSLKDTFKDFRQSALEKFGCLSRTNVLLLTDEQLQGRRSAEQLLEDFYNHVKNVEQLLVSPAEIPDSLKSLFIEDAGRIADSLKHIGIEISNELISRLDIIEDVRKKLEYIFCIEKVVEKDNKSRNILACYQENAQTFCKEIREIQSNLRREARTRKILIHKLTSVPDITNLLMEVDESYLFASTQNELLRMQRNLDFYLQASSSVAKDISERPNLRRHWSQEMHDVSSVSNEIKLKMHVINRHIGNRKEEVVCKYIPQPARGVVGTIIFCAGFACITTLDEGTQWKVLAGSFLLFAAFSWKSVYMRTKLSRIRRRYKQMILNNYVRSLSKLFDKIDLLLEKIYKEQNERTMYNVNYCASETVGAVGVGTTTITMGAYETCAAIIGSTATIGLSIPGLAVAGAGIAAAYVFDQQTRVKRKNARHQQNRD